MWSKRALCVTVLSLLMAIPVVAKEKEMIEKFRATSMDADSRPVMVEIGISAWSTEEERQELMAALNDGGSKAVGELLQKMKDKSSKGFITLPNMMGQDLGYAYQFNEGDTRIVIVATNRPVTMGESMAGSLSQDNNITFANLVLDSSNDGKGQLYVGARMYVDDAGKLAVKDSISATDLTSVKPEKVK